MRWTKAQEAWVFPVLNLGLDLQIKGSLASCLGTLVPAGRGSGVVCSDGGAERRGSQTAPETEMMGSGGDEVLGLDMGIYGLSGVA